jgi:hypothetical protein
MPSGAVLGEEQAQGAIGVGVFGFPTTEVHIGRVFLPPPIPPEGGEAGFSPLWGELEGGRAYGASLDSA